MNFSELPPILGEALAERGYDTPTEVQSAVIAPEASGRDLVVSAQTGSGKTVAFGLAMAEQMLAADGKVPFGVAPLALVIVSVLYGWIRLFVQRGAGASAGGGSGPDAPAGAVA